MKTIIVPTDFSVNSDNAMNYAAGLARETGSSILLFHAYQIPLNVTDVPLVLISVEDLQKNAEEKIREVKRSLEQQLAGVTPVDADAKLGDTVDELENICRKVEPFAVVMGTKGESALERSLFGSTALSAIRHLAWPVIVVPPATSFTGIDKIGFACDFKEVAVNTPIAFIRDFVTTMKAELFVLNVNVDHKNSSPEAIPELQTLQTMLAGLKVNYEFIDDENVEDGIEKFSQANALNLVITIPKKHKLLDRLFKKSHTKQLVFHSHIPIMCVHE